MTESELRAGVETSRDVSAEMWVYLEDEQKVKYALDEMEGTDKERVDYLVGEIDRIWAAASDHAGYAMPAGGEPYSKMFEFLQKHDRERAEVRNEVLAKYATTDPLVRAFRSRFTGGEPLSRHRAETFAESPAAANLPTRWFEENEVPFVDHDARVLSVDIRGETKVVEFVVDPPGATFRVERRPKTPEYAELIVAGGEQFRQPGVTTIVRSGSPLDELRKVSLHLSELSLSWQHSYAARFVLVAEPPEERPLWTERGPSNEIVMHMAPWISRQSRENAFARELWFRGWMNERYGGLKAKRRRRLSQKSIRLVRFLNDRIDHHGRRPNGRDFVAEWDAMYPDWSYRGDTRSMWRDFNRALRAVAPETVQKDR
jgi:hypothetical protein